MTQVKLMNRTDTKYCLTMHQLDEVFERINDQYFQLFIDGENELPYTTTYYDFPDNKLYTTHHNGKQNRYKIRKRSYAISGIQFLEVKFKNNKGRTIKSRLQTTNPSLRFNKEESAFLAKTIPFEHTELGVSLFNSFNRITLVNKNFKERCTIDFNLNFESHEAHKYMDKLVIIEIKADGYNYHSPLARMLRDLHIKKMGFSKYCIGKMYTDQNVKKNAFKEKLRSIDKLLIK